MKLSNKTIVITGASKGLGREIAIRLSNKNTNLILIARTKKNLEEVQDEIKNFTGKTPFIISCNVSNENDVNRMALIIKEKYKKIDVLINNAGISISKKVENMTIEEMRNLVEVNFYGVFYCTKALLALIKKSDAGYILNISSLLSKMSFAETSVYSATKFALSGFSEGLRYEMKKNNIRVGVFMPGPMATSFQENRENEAFKAPALITLSPQKAAQVIEKMIDKKKKKVIMYYWILLIMKIKQMFG